MSENAELAAGRGGEGGTGRANQRIAALLLIVGVVLAVRALAGGRATAEGLDPLAPQHQLLSAADMEVKLTRIRETAPGGEVTAATVFGPDERYQPASTTAALIRTVAQLVMFDEYSQILWTCSGTILNPTLVLTAAHCLHSPDGAQADSVLVVPGQDGLEWPYGTAYGVYFSYPVGWSDNLNTLASTKYDVGLVHLAVSDFGNATAPYFGVGIVSPGSLDPAVTHLATAGYPSDKPVGTMWISGTDLYQYDDTFVRARFDSYSGQSGVPSTPSAKTGVSR